MQFICFNGEEIILKGTGNVISSDLSFIECNAPRVNREHEGNPQNLTLSVIKNDPGSHLEITFTVYLRTKIII